MSPSSRLTEAARAVESRHIVFDDNCLLPALFGRHDEHLARIEQGLGVALVSRGNKLAISGAPWSAEAAKLVIESLRQRLERGLDLDAGEVDAAIRLVVQGGGGTSESHDDLAIITQQRRISPRSLVQATYLRALRDHDLVFALGPAGTGKTWLAVACAVDALEKSEVQRILLVRPAVEAGEKLGFLPGDLAEKIDPYLRPLYDALHDMAPTNKAERLIEDGTIEIIPMAYMRGRTFNSAFVILDEAQNTTRAQMKMFLTRLGANSKAIITGDVTQIDLPEDTVSGLVHVQQVLNRIKGIAFVYLTEMDVVRHRLVQDIIKAYEKVEEKEKN